MMMVEVVITFWKLADPDGGVVGEAERGHQVVGRVLVQGRQGGQHSAVSG